MSLFLPQFSFDERVSMEGGRNDKIEIEIGNFLVRAGHRNAFPSPLHRLGPPPPNAHGIRRSDFEQMGAYGWIFCATSLDDLSSRTVNVRSDPIQFAPIAGITPPSIAAPLFSGHCKWWIGRVRRRESGGSAYPALLNGKLRLSINPTRYVRHRSGNDPLPLGLRRARLSIPPMGELSFDGKDNWLPQSAAVYRRASEANWQDYTARYLRGVTMVIQDEFCRVFCLDQGLMENPLEYSVRSVETYWEWADSNPTSRVAELRRCVETFSARYRGMRTYETLDEGIIGNSRILQMQTRAGEWLKIYAKTNQRIRIEITHKLTGKNPFKFPRQQDAEGNTQRISAHRFESQAGVIRYFDRIREQAAEVVNDFLSHAATQMQPIASSISGYMAMAHVLEAMMNPMTALNFIDLLVNNGGIAQVGWSRAEQRSIALLRDRKIIELVPNRRIYVPAAKYRFAFQMLRDHGRFPQLNRSLRTR